MQVRLHPVGTGLAPIPIDETLFTIGRGEDVFAHYDKSLVARLSRRHAKIFQENGAVYVADLNSRNGTFVNGETVDPVPKQLFDGDELEVGKMQFRIEIGEDASLQTVVDSDVVILLDPVNKANGLAPIVVTRFPFLIRRDSEIFEPYLERAAEQVEYISGKHAHLYFQNGKVYVEDLGSTNGTLLNDTKLTDHASALQSGDTIAFGGEFFEYRIQVLREDESTDRTVLLGYEEMQRSDGTIFVDSPTSFIDIFDTQDKVEKSDEPAKPAVAQPSSRPNTPAPKPVMIIGMRRWQVVTATVVTLAVLAGGYYYYARQPSFAELERHFYAGDYLQATRVARALLQQGRTDPNITRLSTVVILRAHVPLWMDAFGRRDELATARAVDELRATASSITELEDYAQLLEWTQEVRHVLASPQPSPGELNRLSSWWRSDPAARRQVIARLVGFVPEAASIGPIIEAQVRDLQRR